MMRLKKTGLISGLETLPLRANGIWLSCAGTKGRIQPDVPQPDQKGEANLICSELFFF